MDTEGGIWQVTFRKKKRRGEFWQRLWVWFRGQQTHFNDCWKVKWHKLVFNWHLNEIQTDWLGEPLKHTPQTSILAPYFSYKGRQTVYTKTCNRQRSWPNLWPHLSHLPNILLSTAHTHKYTSYAPIKSIKTLINPIKQQRFPCKTQKGNVLCALGSCLWLKFYTGP